MIRVLAALCLFPALLLGCNQGNSAMTAGAETRDGVTAKHQIPAEVTIDPPLKEQLEEQTTEPPAPGASSPDPILGEKIYNRTCVVCHGAGIAGAPRVGSRQDWKDRIAQGLDTLTTHAINGYSGSSGFMPPRGGDTTLTDEEIASAVAFMVEKSR